MVNTKKTRAIVICIFVLFACNTIPVYYVNKLAFKFSPIRNKTIFGLVLREGHEHIESIYLSINNLVIPLVVFLIITVCTIILATQLRDNAEWRTEAFNASKTDKLASRNKRVAKMVVLISIVYIVCFVPTCAVVLAIAFDRTLFFSGKYFNMTIIISGFGYVMESINSSMNIFIYHSMSSKYRKSVFPVLHTLHCV